MSASESASSPENHDPQKIGKVIITGAQIQKRLRQIAQRIDPKGKPVSLLWVANGAMFFAADLLRTNGTFHHESTAISVVRARRYSGTVGSNLEHDTAALDFGFHSGRNIILIDDILDEGITLLSIYEVLKKKLSSKTRIDVIPLVRKIGAQALNFNIPILCSGFELHSRCWVFGYGMDHENAFRTEPSIWMLMKSKLPKNHPGRESYPVTSREVKITVEGVPMEEWDT